MSGDPRALLQKADKALASASGGFSFFGGREDRYMNAADLYVEAANAFRMQGLMREAGLAFEKAATVQGQHLKEPDDAANTMVECFKVYRKESPEDAVRCLEVAINQYCKKGNFRRAAQHKEHAGEVFEVELGDRKRALECYELAAGWYESDNAAALANRLSLKVADLAALEADYYKAIQQYEKIAESSVNNNLLRYSVKGYLLKAGICHLATEDMVGAARALEKYAKLDEGFPSTAEYKLLADITNAVESQDSADFEDKLKQFDRMSKLDKWQTEILLRVKNTIKEEDFA